MMKETKNSALTTAQAFYHQSIVALDKCFEMEKGDCIYLEKDGDISLITEGENTGSQIEVKDVAAVLTDHHESFWKTLKNWLATGDFGKKATVSETFKAQARSEFTSSIENAKVVSSPNKKLHTITYTRPTLENGKYMMNCWTVDRRDPIGKYVLTVKIGKHEFEKQVFYVTE